MSSWLRPLTAREKRLLCYLGVLVVVVGWFFFWRSRWHPSQQVSTAHYLILSNAETNQTREIAEVVEVLFRAYSNFHRAFPEVTSCAPVKLTLKLYKDRAEFRRCNPGIGWAEAFYRKPYCHAYYSVEELNSYHWMLHEATHQLNAEVAGFQLWQWLEEGLAEYFSTSMLSKGQLRLGVIDRNTYPVWWIDDLATTGTIASDLKNGSVIPLAVIVSGKGGPRMNRHFNLYYLHWWSLTHFLFHFEAGKYRDGLTRLIQEGGSLAGFEKHIGPIGRVQQEWYEYVRNLKAALEGKLPRKRAG